MILINLLPHREERRKRRKQAFFVGLGLSVAAGAMVVGLWFMVLQQMIAGQEARNAFLTVKIKELDEQIKDIASLKAEIDSLKARQRAVEDLQSDRNMPVHLLNELVKQTPEGIYLTAIKQDGKTVNVTGVAQTNERVSEFLRNTAYNSPWLEKPELQEIKVRSQPNSKDSRDVKRLFDFSVRVSLKRPADAQADAPGGAASGASAPPAPARAASASKSV